MQATRAAQQAAVLHPSKPAPAPARTPKPKRAKRGGQAAPATGGAAAGASGAGPVAGLVLLLVLLSIGGCAAGMPRVSVGGDGVCVSTDAPPTAPVPVPAASRAFVVREAAAPAAQEVTVRVVVEPQGTSSAVERSPARPEALASPPAGAPVCRP